MLRHLCFLLAITLSVSVVRADLTAMFKILTDGEDNRLSVDGYVTQDLLVNTGLDWGTAQILATLDTGEIYQNPEGGDFAPNPALFDTFPDLKYDSYLDGNGSPPSIAGAAVTLGGDVQAFNNEHIDITWYNTSLTDIGNGLSLGRFTLSEDATGTWSMMISTDGNFFVSYQGMIENGEFDLRPTTGGEPVPGDLNNDFYVGVDDLNIVLAAWNQHVYQFHPNTYGDINEDFFVGVDDLNVVLTNWNQSVLIGDAESGDLNSDGFVGVDDLNVILSNWNVTVPNASAAADPNGDLFIGVDDLNIVLANWNAGTPPTLESVLPIPEPSAGLCLLGMIGLGLGRRGS